MKIIIILFLIFFSIGYSNENLSRNDIPPVYNKWPFDCHEAIRRQDETAKALSIPKVRQFDLGNQVSIELILIPAGRFFMGSSLPKNSKLFFLFFFLTIFPSLFCLFRIFKNYIFFFRINKNFELKFYLKKILFFYIFTGFSCWLFFLWRDAKTRAEYFMKTESPIHEVTIEVPFYMSKFEITKKQWYKVMGQPQGLDEDSETPITEVSWYDAQNFCFKLKNLLNVEVFLPSEAEWEFACRAGSEEIFFHGSDILSLSNFAWFREKNDNSFSPPQPLYHPVGKKQPNAFGLFDILGNVWEWVEDDWHENYLGAPRDGRPWLKKEDCLERVCRGGAAWVPSKITRCGARWWKGSGWDPFRTGFRIISFFPLSPSFPEFRRKKIYLPPKPPVFSSVD